MRRVDDSEEVVVDAGGERGEGVTDSGPPVAPQRRTSEVMLRRSSLQRPLLWPTVSSPYKIVRNLPHDVLLIPHTTSTMSSSAAGPLRRSCRLREKDGMPNIAALSEEGLEDETNPEPPTKRRRKNNSKTLSRNAPQKSAGTRGKRKSLSRLPDMPLDILYEVCLSSKPSNITVTNVICLPRSSLTYIHMICSISRGLQRHFGPSS